MSPTTMAMGTMFAALRLQWRSAFKLIKSERYWAGLSVMWF